MRRILITILMLSFIISLTINTGLAEESRPSMSDEFEILSGSQKDINISVRVETEETDDTVTSTWEDNYGRYVYSVDYSYSTDDGYHFFYINGTQYTGSGSGTQSIGSDGSVGLELTTDWFVGEPSWGELTGATVENIPPEVTSVSVPSISASRSFTVSWNYSDEDGDNQERYFVDWERQDGSGYGNSGNIDGSNTSYTLTVPDDGEWDVGVRVYDGYDWSSIVISDIIKVDTSRPSASIDITDGESTNLRNVTLDLSANNSGPTDIDDTG